MRCILAITVFLIVSCTQKNETAAQITPGEETKVSFVCDYANNKIRSKQLYQEFKQSRDDAKEKKFISFLKDSLLPCWYGTEWNFYGTTEEPGKGTIACGYFVTTVLRDAGLSLQRIKLAQCASEEMIKAVCNRSSIRRFSNISLFDFTNRVKAMEPGLYIVGLDNHTGFILNDGEETFFIHSTYVHPGGVMKEIAAESLVLGSSKYRVIGKVKL